MNQPTLSIVSLLRRFEAKPASIGTMSTGEACAVALLTDRLELLSPPYDHPVAAFDRLGVDWQQAVLEIYRQGWNA